MRVEVRVGSFFFFFIDRSWHFLLVLVASSESGLMTITSSGTAGLGFGLLTAVGFFCASLVGGTGAAAFFTAAGAQICFW